MKMESYISLGGTKILLALFVQRYMLGYPPGWPSGLRRSLRSRVRDAGRGFESTTRQLLFGLNRLVLIIDER